MYDESLNTTGWNRLSLTMNHGSYEEVESPFAAGFAEGRVSRDDILTFYGDLRRGLFGETSTPPAQVQTFLSEQLAFFESLFSTASRKSRTFEGAGHFLYWQLQGLVAGVNESSFTLLDAFILQSAGDLETLLDMYPPTTPSVIMEARKAYPLLDCSALVGLSHKDIFAGHATWTAYWSSYRTYKVYDFHAASTHALVSFSSRPGVLTSKDDWYQLGSGLVVMETTNAIFNTSLYDQVVPKTIPTWGRAYIANALAATRSDWLSLFPKYNSGTYNNQWIIVDTRSRSLSILEQVPGLTMTADLTHELQTNGYFPSYNIPHIPEIYNISGYPEHCASNPDDVMSCSYTENPRAQLFRTHANAAIAGGPASFCDLLRRNEWKVDPESMGNPTYAIAARADLLHEVGGKDFAFGAVDAKCTSGRHTLGNHVVTQAQSSPAYNGFDAPPFSWDAFPNITWRTGQPQKWNFPWKFMAYTIDEGRFVDFEE
jgi:hypothetical protein